MRKIAESDARSKLNECGKKGSEWRHQVVGLGERERRSEVVDDDDEKKWNCDGTATPSYICDALTTRRLTCDFMAVLVCFGEPG